MYVISITKSSKKGHLKMCPGTVQYFKAENMVTHRCTMTLKSCSCEAGVLTPAESNYSNLT